MVLTSATYPNHATSSLRGVHGGPATCTQVAVVSGGHPRVAALARLVGAVEPPAAMWAPLIASLLGVRWPAAGPAGPAG